ncbi:unnamed protein product [Pleuronectes platessa]|uniref:G-protein coupled receptors family 1 profile domain-containing protein n=1 Tax=Pleuronectes platessa TaxID=8262 RepID=A0A9N7V8L9_PLEPL|nr:unnamed protein product [Pleuronectes platessa]
MARRLTLLKAPELLTVNLAITDIGMALSMYPLSITSAFNHAWIGGDASCLYYSLMGMIFSITSIMTLTMMGMVRYLVTGSPPETGIKFQRQTVYMVIIGIWLYAGLWALLPLLGWGSYGPEPFGLACSIDWTGYGNSLNHSTFILTLAVLCTFLPSLVIIFSYCAIAWKLHRAYQSIQSNDFHYSNVEKKITLVQKQRKTKAEGPMPLEAAFRSALKPSPKGQAQGDAPPSQPQANVTYHVCLHSLIIVESSSLVSRRTCCCWAGEPGTKQMGLSISLGFLIAWTPYVAACLLARAPEPPEAVVLLHPSGHFGQQGGGNGNHSYKRIGLQRFRR